jgi:multidrug efflux pump subunit AcrB
MASSVATPLEQQFAAIPGLAQMTSTSGIGTTRITLQFELSRNIDGAAGDVQTAINAASGVLPKDLPTPPTYKKTNPADRAILIYAVSSDALPIYRVDDYAYTILAQKISTISGVSEVDIAGQQQYAVHVQVNPLALAARNISLEDIHNALTAATLDQPKGNLEGERQVYTLDTNDQLFDARSFFKVIVAYRNGAPVRIEDVGTVIDSSQYARTGAWLGDKGIELLLIRRQAGANTLAVVDQIKAEMPTLLASIPPTVHVELVSDRSENIRESVNDVQLTLVLTITLVVLVIFLFLHNLWATIIPSIVVPLSLVGTFGVIYALGYSLDNLSLMGLTIAVVFVVDDAIVMIENIVRYLEKGDPPFEAALKGAGQIGFTIVSMTVSLVAVFIPLLFMAGIVGRLFREFAITVTTAVLVSGVISLTLTPVMCSRFITLESMHGRNLISRWSERSFERLIRGYDRELKWVLRHQLSMLVLTLALMFATAALYVWIPKGFFPEQDTGFIFGQAEARQDISFAAMAKIENRFAQIIMSDPAVARVET